MFRNYLKIAFRNIVRNKVASMINVFGLAAGLATCLLISMYILDETSYDKHHKNGGRVYRIAYSVDNSDDKWTALAAPVAQGLKTDFPEVAQVTRLLKFPNLDKMLLTYKNDARIRQFNEPNGYYVDSTFFQIFTYEFLSGDAQTALNSPNSIVLSDQLAGKLFEKDQPLGKTIRIGTPFGDSYYTVTGVFNGDHIKSHIPAHFLLSMQNSDVGTWAQRLDNWATNNIFHTYVLLNNDNSTLSFEEKLKPFFEKRAGADLKALGVSKNYFLQPLKDIYLHSNFGYEIAPNGNARFLFILGSIAVFILLIACINFMNLATARSEKRAREVGVRKVMGAEKGSLIVQFLGESFMMCSISLLLGLLLAGFLLPAFNNLTEKQLEISANPSLLFLLGALALITGLLSGLYPAWYLSSFAAVSMLKGKMLNRFSAVAIRKGLVTFQFTISITLIIGAIVIWQQLEYIENKELGFNKDQQIALPLNGESAEKTYPVLKNELLKNLGVKSVTCGSTYPGILNAEDMLFYGEGKTVEDVVDIHLAAIDYDYFATLGMELLYGSPFSENVAADSSHIILNEAALDKLGYKAENAVGRKLQYDWRGEHFVMTITGVVKNFNFESLHNEIRPFGFATTFFADRYSYAIANLKTDNYPKLLADVEKTWKSVNPDIPFEYSFLDSDFMKNYAKERRTSSIIIYFTIIAIFIACLGLYGLVSFSTEQRIKEIGIRKVLGASTGTIVELLSGDFLKLVFIACAISIPVAYYFMSKWLENFAYRIDIQWWIFIVAGAVAVAVAFLTVGFQSVKAALANPVKSLRSE